MSAETERGALGSIQPTCTVCGAPARKRTVSRYTGYDTTECPACRRRSEAERRWRNEQFMEDDVICPWCGHKDCWSMEYDDEETEIECERCGRTFEVEIEVKRSYTTWRPENEMPAGYEYMDNEERKAEI